jgi:serine/threonine protein kinase
LSGQTSSGVGPLSLPPNPRKIGQGGMGEVCRAEDTNLSCEVTIKVLCPCLFSGIE